MNYSLQTGPTPDVVPGAHETQTCVDGVSRFRDTHPLFRVRSGWQGSCVDHLSAEGLGHEGLVVPDPAPSPVVPPHERTEEAYAGRGEGPRVHLIVTLVPRLWVVVVPVQDPYVVFVSHHRPGRGRGPSS